MSYDIDLRIDTGGKYPAVVADIGSPTYNLRPMFVKALQVAGVESMRKNGDEDVTCLDGMLAQDAIPVLQTALQDMRDNKDEYVLLNPSNGWGSYPNAVETFERILEACEHHPKATVNV